ncbi:MAG: hypothetical protein AAFX00_13890 [Pseudomonadota bacterium]
MQVKDVLDKVVSDQRDALAVLVRHGAYAYQNLQTPYDMIDAKDVLATVDEIYGMTDSLEAEGYEIGDMILSFDNHSLVSRRIDEGAIVVLTKALGRPQLIKLQVALGLYTRALEKALANEATETVVETGPETGPETRPETAPEAAPETLTQAEAVPAPIPEDAPKLVDSNENGGLARGFGRFLGKAFSGDGTASPQKRGGLKDEEIKAAILAGKKVRHYRGQAYIE